MRYKYYWIVLFSLASMSAVGQVVPRGTEMQQLVKIADNYANIPYLSFDLKYTYADSLTWHDLTDSMFAACKMSYGKSLITNTAMEYLKGKDYNVFVNKEDSIIVAYRRKAEEDLFKVPLLDTSFINNNVDSMKVYVIDDSTWQFLVMFKPESFYTYYEMNYDPDTQLVKSINYHAHNYRGENNIPADHIVCATIYMYNYSQEELDPVLFNEARYFYQLNGGLYLQPAWQTFQFENY